jgi:hypothetical protein
MLANGADNKPKIEARRKGAKGGVCFRLSTIKSRFLSPSPLNLKDALINASCRLLY